MNNDFKYKTSFASSITKITNAELDKYISLAGLESLKELMPKEIDFSINKDLIGAALNAVVIGRSNLNGDAVTNEVGIKVAKSFLYKFVDSLHKRSRIIGTIVNSGYSEFGSNKILTEEEVLKTKDPVNVSLAILLYKLILPDEYIELIEGSADPSSADFGRISGSWEVIFNDYDIAIGGRNVSEATVYTEEKDKKELEKYLQAEGGPGKKDNEYVYRIIKGDFIIASGLGLVDSPASDVKGLTLIEANINDNRNNISHSESLVVNKLDKKESDKTKIMKISTITDLTDESVKQCVASDLREFIETELKKKSEEWVKEKTEKDRLIQEANQKFESISAEHKTTQETLKTIQAELQKLKDEKEAQAKQEKFNQRMASIDETYELDNDSKAVIAKQIKDLSDEDYAEYEKSLAALMKDKKKMDPAKKKEMEKKMAEEKMMKEEKKEKESTASVVDKALETADKDKIKTPNAAEPGTESLKDKFNKAFADDQFEIVIGRKKNSNN